MPVRKEKGSDSIHFECDYNNIIGHMNERQANFFLGGGNGTREY